MPRKLKINIEEIRALAATGLSTYEIADRLSCNQSHVYRLIVKNNKENPAPGYQIKIHSKSDAQKAHIQKCGHQRKGATLSEDEKTNISNTMRDFYESPEGQVAKDKISEARANEWAATSNLDKQTKLTELRVANLQKVRSGQGSKFENFVAEQLVKNGYAIIQRTFDYTPQRQFEIDIALTSECLAIEIDGPTHFSDIYGAQKLQEVQYKDRVKDSILLGNGWDVLRIQDVNGSTSMARASRILESVKTILANHSNGPRQVTYLKP